MQGKVLKDHPPFKFCISTSGAMFRDPSICDIAYKDPIKAKSVHFIGAKDWLRRPSEDFAAAFDNPLIIRHPYGHTFPRLGSSQLVFGAYICTRHFHMHMYLQILYQHGLN